MANSRAKNEFVLCFVEKLTQIVNGAVSNLFGQDLHGVNHWINFLAVYRVKTMYLETRERLGIRCAYQSNYGRSYSEDHLSSFGWHCPDALLEKIAN